MFSKIICVLFLLFQVSLFAWRDTGHMAISQIASSKLTLTARQNIKELLDVMAEDYPESSDLLTASVWADDVANTILGCSWTWHGQRRPYDPTHFLTDRETALIYNQFKDNDVVFAINRALCILKDPKAKKIEKAIELRFLLHFVGDAHMPLHCANFYSEKFPGSDLGGGKFKIQTNFEGINNLHSLWDSMVGLDTRRFSRPLNFINHEAIISLAYNIMREHLDSQKSLILDPREWVLESYDAAINVAYKDIELNETVSEKYIQKSRECACERIALAGYRLGNILNETFDPNYSKLIIKTLK